MNKWNPMEDDYNSLSFNSYNRGPGRDLPMESHPRFKTNAPPMTQLYLQGIPPDISDQGLKILFSKYGHVHQCHLGQPKEGQSKRFGFVTYGSIREAEKAICGLNGKGPYYLRVEFALSKSDKRLRDEAKNNELENIKEQVFQEMDRTPQRHTRQSLLQAPSSQQFISGSSSDISSFGGKGLKVCITGGKKTVSYDENGGQENNNNCDQSGDKCLVEHFTAVGPNNKARSRATGSAMEIRTTGYGMIERRVVDSSESYSCSFVTSQLARQPCTLCKKLGGFRCPLCKSWYCGQSCQLRDWPQHKLICQVVNSGADSVKGLKIDTNQVNNSITPNNQRQNGYAANDNKPQKGKPDTYSRTRSDRDFKNTSQGPQKNQSDHNYFSGQRKSVSPKGFNKQDDGGNFRKPQSPRTNNQNRSSSQMSDYYKGGEKPGAAAPQHSRNTNSRDCDSRSEQGQTVWNPFSNGSAEPRKPLRRPGKAAMEICDQVQSVCSEFFKSGPCEVQVCFVISPDEFYVQKISDQEKLHTLLIEVHQEASCGKPLNVPLSPGDHCIALFTDGNWYRARVLKFVEPKSHEVYFVDFGNKDTVLLENMRLLPTKFRSVPEQALQCSMDKMSPSGSGGWEQECITNFSTFVSDRALKCYLRAERNGTAVVDLEYEKGQFVSQWMLQLGIAKKTDVPSSNHVAPIVSGMKTEKSDSENVSHLTRNIPSVPTKSGNPPRPGPKEGSPSSTVLAIATVFKAPLPSVLKSFVKSEEPLHVAVTWVVDENNFWVTVTHSELNQLVAQASEILSKTQDNLTSSFAPSVGEVVGAKFSDGCFYRALLKGKSNPNSYKVLFVDFGNEDEVTLVTPLPPNLSSFASPAFQLHSKQAHHFEINTSISLKTESVNETEAVFVHLNEEGKALDRFIGRPWYSGHIAPEEPITSPPILQPKCSSPQPVKQASEPEENKGRPSVSSPISSPRLSERKRSSPQPVGQAQQSKQNVRQLSASSPVCANPPAIKPPLPSILCSGKLHIQTEPIKACPTYPSDSKNFWISVLDDDSLVTKLSDINAVLTATHEEKSVGYSAFPGQLVSARSSEDQTCYRAYIKSLVKGKQYHVLFLDFGNEEDVPSVAPLPPEALSFPSTALQMSSHQPIELSGLLYLRISTVGTDFATFTQLDEEGNEICELVGKPWYSGHLVETDHSTNSVMPALEVTLPMFADMPERQFDMCFEASISYVSSHKEIYLQKVCDIPELNALQSRVNDVAASAKQNVVPIFGQVVLALEVDGVWYRAKVVGVSSKEALVHFVDFGNQSQVALNDLRLCPEEFSKEAAFAIHVSLDGIDSITLEEATELMTIIWKVNITEKVQGVPSVKLFGPNGQFGQSVQEEFVPEVPVASTPPSPVQDTSTLVNTEEADPACTAPADTQSTESCEEFCTRRYSEHPYVNIPSGEIVKVEISAVSSPDVIFVRYFPTQASAEKWVNFEREIQVYCNSRQAPANFKPEPAQFCLAMFSEDQRWYRAIVMGMAGDDYKVLFVDYGNVESTSTPLLPIPARFMELPVQALTCRLYGIECPEIWTEEVCEALQTMTRGKFFDVKITFKNEELSDIDIPEVRKQLVEMNLVQLDAHLLELEANHLSSASGNDRESCVESLDALGTNVEQDNATASQPVANNEQVDKPVSDSSETVVNNDTEDGDLEVVPDTQDTQESKAEEILKQIEILKGKLALLKSK